MPRIRSIKPGFFTSEDVSVLPLRARLTWIGLWTHCDDHGRAKDNTRLIKAALWALDDVTLKDVDEDLELLAAQGRIVRYEVSGNRYLAVTNWGAHQHPNRPIPSVFPAPPTPPIPDIEPASVSGTESSVRPHGGLSADARTAHGGLSAGEEGRGTEGRGGELARVSDRQPRRARAPSTGDQRVAAAMDLAASYEAQGL